MARPVDIARIALLRLSERNAAPTPENYNREYRLAAGLPGDAPRTPGQESIEAVQSIVLAVMEASAKLVVGIDKLDTESIQALANTADIHSPDDLARLLQSVAESAHSLKGVIEVTRQELAETRDRLDKVSGELEQAQALARTDPLTGLSNRRGMAELLAREIARSHRTQEAFSIAMLDIDHFKQINDEHGHDVGDLALLHLAKMAKSSIRGTDEICRYGGEEFVVTLPGALAQGAHFVVDRMRSQLERSPLVAGKRSLVLHYSAGVAQLQSGENADGLLKRADQALYEAKSSGRNRVIIAAPLTA